MVYITNYKIMKIQSCKLGRTVLRGHCPFCFIYTIANHISKSLAIPVTDTTFFQRYCIKCKEDMNCVDTL